MVYLLYKVVWCVACVYDTWDVKYEVLAQSPPDPQGPGQRVRLTRRRIG